MTPRRSHQMNSGQLKPLFTPGQMEFILVNDFQALKLINEYALKDKPVQPLEFMIELRKRSLGPQ